MNLGFVLFSTRRRWRTSEAGGIQGAALSKNVMANGVFHTRPWKGDTFCCGKEVTSSCLHSLAILLRMSGPIHGWTEQKDFPFTMLVDAHSSLNMGIGCKLILGPANGSLGM